MKPVNKIYNIILFSLIFITGCIADFDYEYLLNKNLHVFSELTDTKYDSIKSLNWDLSGISEVNLLWASSRAAGGDTSGSVSIQTVPGIDWGIINNTTITKEKNIYNSVNATLPDGKLHAGDKCTFISTGVPFYIYPIFACGAYTWDLYVKVGNEEAMICSKGWTLYDKPYVNGMVLNKEFALTVPVVSIGLHACNTCEGNGFINVTIPVYDTKDCDKCIRDKDGIPTGKVTCTVCGGLGYTSTGLFTKRYSGCAACGGKGNNQSSLSKITKGTGKVDCSTCNGSGEIIYNTGQMKDSVITCSDCQGTGISKVINLNTTLQTNTINMPGVEINAPIGTNIEIYIKNINGNANSVPIGTTTGSAIYVEPQGNPEFTNPDLVNKKIIKYVGIEDTYDEVNKQVGGDKDYNDIVLAIIGNDIPLPIVIEDNGEYTVEVINKKRYMIEDLGASRELLKENKTDIDFNDLVIDFNYYTYVTHSRTTTYTNKGSETKDIIIDSNSYTDAIIRAMGGTLDFILYVDNVAIFLKSWGLEELKNHKIEINDKYTLKTNKFEFATMYNCCDNLCGYVTIVHAPTDGYYYTDNDDEKSWLCKINNIEGYNINENNISFRLLNIEGADNNINNLSNSRIIEFPKTGTMPQIIAFPITKVWKDECNPIDKTWLLN